MAGSSCSTTRGS
ncbi:hypothetical protein FXN61_34910 [Lentzea sp. PSKA42]|uniref:Uncharacterized protein n=1 Tax=Lentzea indica TaxID=2604800 RepID=A0ABX1FRN2_9PSEU|nr:hypothetical protein [Lentzea indica]